MTGKDRDHDSGKYMTTYADEEFLRAIREVDRLAGTADVATAVGCSRRTAYTRLKAIEADGRIKGHHVGTSIVWSISKQ